MKLEEARAIVDAWRGLAGNQYADTFLALLDAMPEEDPEGYAAAVQSLAAGLPEQNRDLVAMIVATGQAAEQFLPDPDRPPNLLPRGPGGPSEVPPTDVLDFLRRPTEGLGHAD